MDGNDRATEVTSAGRGASARTSNLLCIPTIVSLFIPSVATRQGVVPYKLHEWGPQSEGGALVCTIALVGGSRAYLVPFGDGLTHADVGASGRQAPHPTDQLALACARRVVAHPGI